MVPPKRVLGTPNGDKRIRLGAPNYTGEKVIDNQRGRTTYVHHNQTLGWVLSSRVSSSPGPSNEKPLTPLRRGPNEVCVERRKVHLAGGGEASDKRRASRE